MKESRTQEYIYWAIDDEVVMIESSNDTFDGDLVRRPPQTSNTLTILKSFDEVTQHEKKSKICYWSLEDDNLLVEFNDETIMNSVLQ